MYLRTCKDQMATEKKTVVMILVKVHLEMVNECLVGWMSSECPLIPKLKEYLLLF